MLDVCAWAATANLVTMLLFFMLVRLTRSFPPGPLPGARIADFMDVDPCLDHLAGQPKVFLLLHLQLPPPCIIALDTLFKDFKEHLHHRQIWTGHMFSPPHQPSTTIRWTTSPLLPPPPTPTPTPSVTAICYGPMFR